jgi:hypothetical protein
MVDLALGAFGATGLTYRELTVIGQIFIESVGLSGFGSELTLDKQSELGSA